MSLNRLFRYDDDTEGRALPRCRRCGKNGKALDGGALARCERRLFLSRLRRMASHDTQDRNRNYA
jgi:hypothetical protein